MPTATETADLAAMTEALFLKLGGFSRVDPEFRSLFVPACTDVATFEAGEMMIAKGSAYQSVFLVDAGWVLRARHLPDGGRQIVSVAVADDFVGLNALMFTTADFDHVCRTPVRAFRFRPAALRELLTQSPATAHALFWVSAHEETILAERIVSLGRRSAVQRAAHVLAELLARLEIIDAAAPPRIAIPISQEDFADILGVSSVHANKVLRHLERQEIVTLRKGMLVVHDRAALERVAGFANGYLHFARRADILLD